MSFKVECNRCRKVADVEWTKIGMKQAEYIHATNERIDALTKRLSEAEALLRRLREWDVIASDGGDGPYWQVEIDGFL